MSNENLHHPLSPSKFPAWAQCPVFDSDPAERAEAAEGTKQHAALAASLAGDEAPLAELDPAARESVVWARNYVQHLAGVDPIQVETKVSYTAPDSFAPGGRSEVYSGTADAVVIRPPGSLADLIDYKSGSGGDHRPQLAGYALALFSKRQRLKNIRCHVLYGRSQTAETWALPQAEAAGSVLPILAARNNPDRQPTACNYCTFCAHRAGCLALTRQVEAVTKASGWDDLLPATASPALLTDPAQVARLLTLARRVGDWGDAIRARAMEIAWSGAILPGYRLQERRGAREVTDLNAAFSRCGLAPSQFLTACKLSLPKLSEALAVAKSVPKAAAAREIETLMADITVEREPTQSLVEVR